jgi:hypothetical protein
MRLRSAVWVVAAPAVALLAACATTPLPPEAERVAVYDAPLDASSAGRKMPGGCAEVRRSEPQEWTELDRTGSKDPYRAERAATAASGGNVLLVLDRMLYPRTDFDCPVSSPITDCPPSLGAWFEVVFVSYACSAKSLSELPAERKP